MPRPSQFSVGGSKVAINYWSVFHNAQWFNITEMARKQGNTYKISVIKSEQFVISLLLSMNEYAIWNNISWLQLYFYNKITGRSLSIWYRYKEILGDYCNAFLIKLWLYHIKKMGLTVKYKLKKTWSFKITSYLYTRKWYQENRPPAVKDKLSLWLNFPLCLLI